MTTVAEAEAELVETGLRTLPGGRGLVLLDVAWADYWQCLDIRDRLRPTAKLTYYRGTMELMTKSITHERYAFNLGRFVSYLCEELGVPCLGCRETTVSREDLERGFEPDEWFYVGPNAARMVGHVQSRQLDFTSDPPPDLAIEVEVSRTLLDRIDIYAAVGVMEIWRFDGQNLTAWRLRGDKTYEAVAVSPVFPTVPLAELVRYVHLAGTVDDTTLARQFRGWVRGLPPAAP